MTGHRMECCDCGLVHVLDYEVVAPSRLRMLLVWLARPLISLRAFRDEAETAERRGLRKSSVP